jgi:O-methyltransferase involved in polyketide biosynthesis
VTDSSPTPGGQEPARLDTNVAHTARIWNYWLGGKDNYPADREVGDQIRDFLPDIVSSARADRAFLGRAVRYLVEEAGIRQFLDIGTGLPTAGNTHEVAQAIAPECRIVYVDNDPLVLMHAQALLTSTPPGVTDYIEADARDTDAILQAAAKTLDFAQPVALMLLGVLNFIGDTGEANAIVNRLIDAVPSGSFLVIAHPTNEINPEASEEAVRFWNENAKPPIILRTGPELARFFDRLELQEPGVVSCPRWRPDPVEFGTATDVYQYAAVGRKA